MDNDSERGSLRMSNHQHDHQHDDVATLVDELEDIDPDVIRSRLMGLATAELPPDSDLPTPKREYLLPAVTLVISAIVILAVVLVPVLTFVPRIRAAEQATTSYLSGEGLVLAEFRRQTEEQLREKDRTIMAALNRLSALETEQQALDELVATRVRQRERELVAELETRLAAERAALAEDNLSEAEITTRVDELRQELAAETAAELSAYRRSVEADVRERAAELQSAEADARNTLELATIERSIILEQSAAAESDGGRASSETLRLIDEAMNAMATTSGDGDAELRRQIADLIAEAEAAMETEAELRSRIAELEVERRDLETDVAGLEAQVNSLRSSAGSSSGTDVSTERLANVEAENASLRARMQAESERLIRTRQELNATQTAISGFQSEIEDLQAALRAAESSAAAAEGATAAAESRVGTVAEQARSRALQDAVEAVRAYEEGGDSTEVRSIIGLTERDRATADALIDELQALVAAAQRSVLDAQLEYRAVGTVSLVQNGRLTVQRLVTLEISSGMLVEVRRTTAAGDTRVVARGTISEVATQRFNVNVTEVTAGEGPGVSDRVFVAVPR
jgi:hypothetical protein